MADHNIVPKSNCIGLDLKKILNQIDDITDPSNMDKLMAYVDKIREEDEEFIELLARRCENTEIYWEQPWYQRDPRITVNPKPTEIDEESPYRTDPISTSEHEKIEKNWRKFRKKYKLPDKIVSLARWKSYIKTPKSYARRFAVAFLSRGLERTKYQVYLHISAYFGGYRKGLYSEVEEKIMETCFYHKPKLVTVILSTLLGRRRRGIYRRLTEQAVGKLEKKRLKWTLPLASKLLNHLLEHTELPLEDLKYKQFDMQIWDKVEKDMEQSSSYLYHFWNCYLHVQLFVKCDVKLHNLKKKVFKILRDRARDSTYKVWSDIRWKNLIMEFPDGFTPRFIYRICYIFIKNLKGYLKMPLEEVAEFALEKIKKQRKKKRNKRLKTLQLRDDGQLEVVDFRNSKEDE